MNGHLGVDDAGLAALAAADRCVVLIGGFDGSGNYGDMIQTQAALDRVARSVPSGVPVAVMLEAHAVSVSPWTSRLLDGQIPLLFADEPIGGTHVPVFPERTVVYLTGGGYVNEMWGPRKLAQLEAVRARITGLAPDALPRVLVSGVQISPHEQLWDWHPWLAGAQPMLVRDAGSVVAAHDAAVTDHACDRGDDAYAWFVAHARVEPVHERCLNVHVNTEGYSAPDAESRLEWLAQAVVALARAGLIDRCRILIAYDDERIGEHTAADRLTDRIQRACTDAGDCDVAFDRVSLPEMVVDGAPLELGAVGTLTCSYHVGLTSLAAGVPTLLLAENAYYQQKMSGLAEQFGVGSDAVVANLDVADVADRLRRVRDAIDRHRPVTSRMLAAQAAAADAEIARALAETERDHIWEQLQMLLPTYRDAVAGSADLQRRIDVIHRMLAAERASHEATRSELEWLRTGRLAASGKLQEHAD